MTEIKKRLREIWKSLTLMGILTYTFRTLSLVLGSVLVSKLLAYALDKKLKDAIVTFIFSLAFSVLVLVLDYLLSYVTKDLNIKCQDRWRGELSSMVVKGNLKIKSPGAYDGRAEKDTAYISSWYGTALPTIVGSVISIDISFIILVYHEPLLAIIFLFLATLSYIPKIVYEKWARINYDRSNSDFEDYIDWVEQGLDGASTLKTYLANNWYMKQFRKWNRKVMRSGFKAESTSTVETMITVLIQSVFSWGAYLIIGGFALFGRVELTVLPLLVVMSQNFLNSAFTLVDSFVYKFLSDEAIHRLGLWYDEDVKEGAEELSVDGVYKSFDDKEVLKGITFTLKKGSKTKLIGENGSGKSTAMKIMLGIDAPDKGTVTPFKGKTAFLFQEDPVLPVTLNGLKAEVLNTGECDSKELDRLLSLFKLEGLMEHKVADLSEGERKKFFIAITLSKDASFIVLDEPTNHVDKEAVDVIVKEIQKRDETMLVCTHDKRVDDVHFDNTLKIEEGRIYG